MHGLKLALCKAVTHCEAKVYLNCDFTTLRVIKAIFPWERMKLFTRSASFHGHHALIFTVVGILGLCPLT